MTTEDIIKGKAESEKLIPALPPPGPAGENSKSYATDSYDVRCHYFGAVSTIAGYLKGKTAMMVFERYSKVKRNFKGQSFWARGYYVSTVGLDESRVRKYIQDPELNDSIADKYDSDPSKPF